MMKQEIFANGHEIWGAKEVASYLQLHLFTVHKLARDGRLPAFKVGRDWRFRRRAIDEWIRKEETDRAGK